jgi:hypothetical protein
MELTHVTSPPARCRTSKGLWLGKMLFILTDLPMSQGFDSSPIMPLLDDFGVFVYVVNYLRIVDK